MVSLPSSRSFIPVLIFSQLASDLILKVRPIGTIKTPLVHSAAAAPIQSSKSEVKGETVIADEYTAGLESLDGFSHVILLYWFHGARPPSMMLEPYLDSREHGLFSTRAPSSPNLLGLSVVEPLGVEGNVLRFRGADMLDELPLIDIKLFIPEFDSRPNA
jgi:tRNA-Thr(GGU) m(6)t(6)A37 methyltransferase TsaA